ncbi:membrane protein insertion efficiency factor YidD [Nostocoides sp.]|jgi:putative membrane protein insertion efficiency factor|uniref:membrane protein insertion efficiency factor YidD n=1 Tax=Nostocoides sp. TaxID=1917966 RepID=UPI002CA2DC6F|nr:membrane protein insertion efficiency factor YidD [Tetrasphaera sp.]
MSPARMVALPLIWALRFYQRWISPLTPPSCRYYPSCSAYAVTAVERFGPIRGPYLAVRRLLRCHPWAPGGVEHVPERFTWRGPHGIPPAPQADSDHPAPPAATNHLSSSS